jgi:hypothetical protein
MEEIMRKSILAIALIAISFVMISHVASADDNFKKNHPRRAEVNQRFKNQNARINQGLRNGTMTQQQAHQIRQQDRDIKAQERADVRENAAMGKGRTLSPQEQAQLNQEQNQTSKEIYQDKHSGQ